MFDYVLLHKKAFKGPAFFEEMHITHYISSSSLRASVVKDPQLRPC